MVFSVNWFAEAGLEKHPAAFDGVKFGRSGATDRGRREVDHAMSRPITL